TFEELERAYNWISALSHEVKVVIGGKYLLVKVTISSMRTAVSSNSIFKPLLGNHDMQLDPFHSKTTRESYHKARNLFTSAAARSKGIYYLDSEVQSITLSANEALGKPQISIAIYGNPHQPEFQGKNWSFIYKPYPSDESQQIWAHAPTKHDNVSIWVSHGGPKNRLDRIPDYPDLEGCRVQ